MKPYDDHFKFARIYTFHLLRSTDGAQHLAQYHGDNGQRGEFFSLTAGRRLHVTLDGSWQGEQVSAPKVAQATGLEWPTGGDGKPCHQPGAWPDPWWDRRNRCPLFRACWRLISDQALPYGNEVSWIVCEVDRLCDRTRCAREVDDELMYDEHLHGFRRYGNDLERFCESFAIRVDLRGQEPAAVLRGLFDEEASDSYWHYIEYEPQQPPGELWESSGWRQAASTVVTLIDQERSTLTSALARLPAATPEPQQLTLEF